MIDDASAKAASGTAKHTGKHVIEQVMARGASMMRDNNALDVAAREAEPERASVFSADINYGPITELLKDNSINDILISGTDTIYIERNGILEPSDYRFSSIEEVDALAHSILASLGRKIDDRRPLVDARLPDGSRVNIIMPPMAIDGTAISIRKFPDRRVALDAMAERGMITPEMRAFLEACGKYRLNVLISGGTGAGKTTMLNALSQSISPKERIITIEDSAELRLYQPHVVRLESKRPQREGDRAEEVTIRDLVINALRMRPDRIIVGEVRGPEAFDMMQAMNTGHEGSMTTLHANTPRDALARLENMIGMGQNLTQKFIRQQMTSAVNLIIQINRFKDGTRRITHISEIIGMEHDVITMQDLFVFKATGEDADGKIQGRFEWCNIVPRHKDLTAVMYQCGLLKAMR